MKCPVDGATLTMADRNGVEIDYCPTCRGVWLDRGELDKIVARAQADTAGPIAMNEPVRAGRDMPDRGYADAPRHRQDDRDRRYRDDDDDDRYRPRKRKESFLSDLFDF